MNQCNGHVRLICDGLCYGTVKRVSFKWCTGEEEECAICIFTSPSFQASKTSINSSTKGTEGWGPLSGEHSDRVHPPTPARQDSCFLWVIHTSWHPTGATGKYRTRCYSYYKVGGLNHANVFILGWQKRWSEAYALDCTTSGINWQKWSILCRSWRWWTFVMETGPSRCRHSTRNTTTTRYCPSWSSNCSEPWCCWPPCKIRLLFASHLLQ